MPRNYDVKKGKGYFIRATSAVTDLTVSTKNCTLLTRITSNSRATDAFLYYLSHRYISLPLIGQSVDSADSSGNNSLVPFSQPVGVVQMNILRLWIMKPAALDLCLYQCPPQESCRPCDLNSISWPPFGVQFPDPGSRLTEGHKRFCPSKGEEPSQQILSFLVIFIKNIKPFEIDSDGEALRELGTSANLGSWGDAPGIRFLLSD
jgi:hypothetical protein